MKYLSISLLLNASYKKTLLFLVIAASIYVLAGCGDEEEPQITTDPDAVPQEITSDAIKIMPLGASRVEGARPIFESYRFELWKLMIAEDWDFDFIGTVEDESNYPSHAGFAFDNDHEGRGGWTSGQILEGLEGWLQSTGSPDIVLFSSPGGNDALEGLPFDEAIENINAIIDLLQANNPKIMIIIEQMAPGQSEIMVGQLADYFEQMQQAVLSIAEQQSTSDSKVIAVDMYTGFTDDLLADDVHYNEAGAVFIAEQYFDRLMPIFSQ
ncbi:MAG: GDSL-type esterase/lipase family protein [Bacteroidota bacterium]